MIDPIAALSLASNVLQVIDFASGFATTAWKLYQAAGQGRDGPDEVVELREINNNLATVLREIRSQPSISEAAITSGDDGIVSLAKECAALVEELLETLPSAIESKRKRGAIRAAFKLKWKSDGIRALQTRLGEFRSQLTLNLQVSMRQYVRQSLAQQESILEQLSSLNHKPIKSKALNDNSYSAERMGTSILGYVTSKLSPASQQAERRLLQNNITAQAMRRGSANDIVGGPWPSNLSISRKVWADSLSDLLVSLNYASMNDRELRVARAHSATFHWLFDENEGAEWTSFKDWLSSEEKLYWITGKAGSGKSTLMKYISHADKSPQSSELCARCHQYLSTWSGSSRLVIVSFYFWNSGTHIQTTQKGLMMTLLQQILKQCPDLTPLASPTRWEMLCLFGDYAQDWDEAELRYAILNALANTQSVGARIALFIDGLDEFEGRPIELIEFLRDIIDLQNVKVCVSSRPWTEFEDAFCHRPSLRLEDLTHNDIKKFVASKFDAEPLFQSLRHREGQYADTLVESIVSRAQGVFLWVALVVSSLIAGLSSGDRVSDLEKRLALLPPDLEGLYDKILLSLDPFYLEHAAQLFALVAASPEPINIVMASFADEEAPDFCLRHNVQEMSEVEIQLCLDTMRRRVNTRTKGLLEIKRPVEAGSSLPLDHERCTIQYLHRTVKDYMQSEAAQKIFRCAMKSSFDPHLRLLAGMVAYMKTLNGEKVATNTVGRHFFRCMEFARNVAASNTSCMVVLLDELDKVISTLWKCKAKIIAYGWTKITREKGLWALEIGPIPVQYASEIRYFGHTLLSLAVACNVIEYVRAKAPPSCIINVPFTTDGSLIITYVPWPLLIDTISMYVPFRCLSEELVCQEIFKTCATPTPEHQNSLVQMLECLLAKGADPAYPIDLGMDTSTSLLIEMVVHIMRTQSQSLTEATRLLMGPVAVDKEMLLGIISRFYTRTFRFTTADEFILHDRLSKGTIRIRGRKYRAYQKKNIQYLKLALNNLRNMGKSDFLINYERGINFVPKYSIKQSVLTTYSTVMLTPGAKYHSQTT